MNSFKLTLILSLLTLTTFVAAQSKSLEKKLRFINSNIKYKMAKDCSIYIPRENTNSIFFTADEVEIYDQTIRVSCGLSDNKARMELSFTDSYDFNINDVFIKMNISEMIILDKPCKIYNISVKCRNEKKCIIGSVGHSSVYDSNLKKNIPVKDFNQLMVSFDLIDASKEAEVYNTFNSLQFEF